MQFFTVTAAFFLAATVSAQGSTCFDDADCFLFAGGGHCVKSSGGFLGTCDSTTTVAPTSTKKGKGHKTTSTPAPTPTSGSICFDDGDCFFSGGHCVKGSGAITGFCVASTTSASSGGFGGFKEFRA